MKTIYSLLSILAFAFSLLLQISSLKCPVFSPTVSKLIILVFILLFLFLMIKNSLLKPKNLFIFSFVIALIFSVVNANGIMMNTCLIQESAKENLDKIAVTQLSQAASRFLHDKDRIPADLQELLDFGYIERKHLLDPWGNKYKIVSSSGPSKSNCEYNGASYEISSDGADGRAGTKDDLNQSLYCKK